MLGEVTGLVTGPFPERLLVVSPESFLPSIFLLDLKWKHKTF